MPDDEQKQINWVLDELRKLPDRPKLFGCRIRYEHNNENEYRWCPLNRLCQGVCRNGEIIKMAVMLGISVKVALAVVLASDYNVKEILDRGYDEALTIRKELDKLCVAN